MRVASAGHPPPLLLRSHGGTEEVGGRGPLLAGFEDAAYRGGAAHLAAGDSLILYTDGVIEAGEREERRKGASTRRASTGCWGRAWVATRRASRSGSPTL